MEVKIKRKGDTKALRLDVKYNEDGTQIPVLSFPEFDKNNISGHFFTTRMGGVSKDHLESLNFSYVQGDDPLNVRENFRRAARLFGEDESCFVLTRQVHETTVLRVGKEEMGCGVTRERPWDGADGLVTNEPGVILGIFFADCVPLLFLDPVNRAIGASHSGWRGTVGRMGRVTLERMHEEFGTRPEDVHAAIGPSICRDCYEVSDEVAEKFAEEFRGHEDRILKDLHNGHQMLDLWEACRITLIEAGVPENNISVTDICTCENKDILFSHRASGGRRGNLGGFIELIPDRTE